MLIICAYCNSMMGEKEPFDDPSKTHGICPKCFMRVTNKFEIQKEIKKTGKGKDGSQPPTEPNSDS